MDASEYSRDAEALLLPQTQSQRLATASDVPKHQQAFYYLATSLFAGLLCLYILSAMYATPQPGMPTDGFNLNSTAWALLSAGAPQLRHMDNLGWQQQQATELASAWGFLTGQLLFARIAGKGQTLDDIINGDVSPWGEGPPALVAVVLSSDPPQRRAAAQPFLSVVSQSSPSTTAADLRSLIPTAAITEAAAGMEAVIGRQLYPLTLEVRSTTNLSSDHVQPYAVYDVSTGRIVLNPGVVENLSQFPEALTGGMATFAESLFGQVARFVASQDHASSLETLGVVVARAAAIAVSGTLVYQTPIWFCVACPAVLGLLAPLVINAGAGAVANAACEHYKLPDADCADLWWSALAVAMIISLASAVPIVYICKLPECARQKRR